MASLRDPLVKEKHETQNTATMMQQPQLFYHKGDAMRYNNMVSIAAKNLVTTKLYASHLSFLLRLVTEILNILFVSGKDAQEKTKRRRALRGLLQCLPKSCSKKSPVQRSIANTYIAHEHQL